LAAAWLPLGVVSITGGLATFPLPPSIQTHDEQLSFKLTKKYHRRCKRKHLRYLMEVLITSIDSEIDINSILASDAEPTQPERS
jgi:hypothetical protein